MYSLDILRYTQYRGFLKQIQISTMLKHFVKFVFFGFDRNMCTSVAYKNGGRHVLIITLPGKRVNSKFTLHYIILYTKKLLFNIGSKS